MTREEYLTIAYGRYDELHALNKVEIFYYYELVF